MNACTTAMNATGGDGEAAQLDLIDSLETSQADEWRVRVSARARRLAIRVYPDARVEVVAPRRARPRDIEVFVATQRQWIEEKRAQALRNRPAPQPFPPEQIELRCTGEQFRLLLAGGEGAARVREMGPAPARDIICAPLRDTNAPAQRLLRVTGAVSRLRPALRGWLLRAARDRLAPRVSRLASAAGVPFERVSIRRQRSRWGSCSVRGTISLNCCLLFQRMEVVDYLIVHELMHVRHMNHSPRFWQAVERHCPDWRALDRELVQGWRQVPRWVFSDESA